MSDSQERRSAFLEQTAANASGTVIGGLILYALAGLGGVIVVHRQQVKAILDATSGVTFLFWMGARFSNQGESNWTPRRNLVYWVAAAVCVTAGTVGALL